MAFNPKPDIYSLEMAKDLVRGTAFTGGSVPGETHFQDNVIVDGTLTVGGVSYLNGGAEVAGGLAMDELTLSADLNLADGSYIYFGDKETDGSWRTSINDDGEWLFEKRVSGSWVEKGAFGYE